mmetsp:Transcript_5536/g.17021  ORF Transcript_5536/g.17021 Transcript_5536/m.17021 type:complete len:81 (+) Transcript_5536:1507-1749(+)
MPGPLHVDEALGLRACAHPSVVAAGPGCDASCLRRSPILSYVTVLCLLARGGVQSVQSLRRASDATLDLRLARVSRRSAS